MKLQKAQTAMFKQGPSKFRQAEQICALDVKTPTARTAVTTFLLSYVDGFGYPCPNHAVCLETNKDANSNYLSDLSGKF